MALTGPEPATIDDCLSMARLHHEAFTKGKQRLYTSIWGGCKNEEMDAFHVEIYQATLRNPGSRNRILVVREDPAGQAGEGVKESTEKATGQVVSYAMWVAPKPTEEEKGEGAAKGGGEGGDRRGGKEDGKYVKKNKQWVFPEGYNAAVMQRSEEEGKKRAAYLPKPADDMWSK
jgi:hypothetical protein